MLQQSNEARAEELMKQAERMPRPDGIFIANVRNALRGE